MVTQPYVGPDRRRPPEPPVPIKRFALVLGLVMLMVGVMLALEFAGTENVEDRLKTIEQQQKIANTTAEDAKVVADFMRDCIFYAAEGKCPVSNLEIHVTDNPAGNPKPSTTTTTMKK